MLLLGAKAYEAGLEAAEAVDVVEAGRTRMRLMEGVVLGGAGDDSGKVKDVRGRKRGAWQHSPPPKSSLRWVKRLTWSRPTSSRPNRRRRMWHRP